MEIHTKAVNATIEDTSANAEEFPGTFLVELSNESIDRDGDELKGEDWETPLPPKITFVNDHTHKMASVVGSAAPELLSGKIICKGEWAETDTAQNTRKVIKHVPYVSVAYREKRDHKAGTVSRELVNGSFVVVPSNLRARVLASKSLDGELDEEAKAFAFEVAQVLSTIEDSTLSKSLADAGIQIDIDKSDGKASLITVKQDGKVLGTHKLSQAPEGGAPGDGSEPPEADQAKDEAAAYNKAVAAAFQLTSTAGQYTETELENA